MQKGAALAVKNTAKEITQRIDDMQNRKKQDLEEIRARQGEARARLAKAKQDIDGAAAVMDLDAFRRAQDSAKQEETALAMYGRRYQQIEGKEYVSEEESNAIIDSLLDYERQLEQDFEKALSSQIRDLTRLRDKYTQDIQETERTLSRWTSEIYPNYRAESATRMLPDGTRTNRMEKPVPVHTSEYKGGGECAILSEYLKRTQLNKDKGGACLMTL